MDGPMSHKNDLQNETVCRDIKTEKVQEQEIGMIPLQQN